MPLTAGVPACATTVSCCVWLSRRHGAGKAVPGGSGESEAAVCPSWVPFLVEAPQEDRVSLLPGHQPRRRDAEDFADTGTALLCKDQVAFSVDGHAGWIGKSSRG